MPQVAIAAAAWIGQAVTVAAGATAGAAAANFVTALGFGQGLLAGAKAWALVASIGMAKGKPKIGGGYGSPTDWKADPQGGIPYVMGETGVGGSIVFATTAETKNDHLLYMTIDSLGPIEEAPTLYVNDVLTTFSGSNAVGAPYHDHMWSIDELGGHTPVVFAPPATTPGAVPEWTSDHKATGLAKQWWVLGYDTKRYPTGTPKRRRVGKWVLVYDPRKDSTFPGGSGSHRANNEGTWEWSDNPFLHALTYVIGRHQNGKRVLGIGAPLAMIDVAAFVEGANVCDANDWKIGGTIYSTDDKYEALATILAAGGGWPDTSGALISCGVNAPRVSLATMTGDDAAGDVTVNAAVSLRDKLNAAVPRYRSADHGYELVSAKKIVVSTWVSNDDGKENCREIDFPLCPDVDQAAQLATYAMANSREFGPVVVPAKSKWRGYKAGDCITLDEPEWGTNDQKVVVLGRRIDPGSGVVTLTFRSETDGKDDFALGRTGVPPDDPSLTGIDAKFLEPPGSGAFSCDGGTLVSDGADLPVIVIEGASDNAHAAHLVVLYRVSGLTQWTTWPAVKLDGVGLPIRVEITGVTPWTEYEMATVYVSPRGVPSALTSEGVATAGLLNANKDFDPPSANLWRKQDYVASGAAAALDPTFGAANWGFKFVQTAGAVTVSGATFPNGLHFEGPPRGRYSLFFLAKMTAGSGTATLRAGFRTASGGAISDISDFTFTITPDLQPFTWNDIRSSDPDFLDGKFVIFNQSGDIGSGEEVTIGDIYVAHGNKAPQSYTPNPNDKEGLRIFGFDGALDATRNKVTQATSAPSSPVAGDIWVDTTDPDKPVTNTWDGSNWVISSVPFTGDLDATRNRVTRSSSAPSSPAVGDWWIDTTESGRPVSKTWTGSTWAEGSLPAALVQNIDAAGHLTTWLALPGLNDARGSGVTFSNFPLTSDDANIYIASSTVSGYGYSRNLPSATLSGLADGTTYGVVFKWDAAFYGAVDPGSVDAFVASEDGWLFLGYMQTALSGGGYSYSVDGAPDGYLGAQAAFNGQYL